MSRVEVRIAGFGGQGIILAGIILARAAVLYDKKKAVQTQSYGSEVRGGAARSEVVISNDPIDYPKLLYTDIFISMSQQSTDKYANDVKVGGAVLIDPDMVPNPPTRKDVRVYAIPATRMAEAQFQNRMAANALMLGALAGLTNVVSSEALIQSIRRSVPKNTEELNLKAYKVGLDLVSSLKSST